MADLHGFVGLELERISPPSFTLDEFHQRRARAQRNRRLVATLAAALIAAAGLAAAARIFATASQPVPASPIGVGAIASLRPDGIVITSEEGSVRTIVTPTDLADSCPAGVSCGFMTTLAWSPSGDRLAFAFGDRSPNRTGAAVYIVNADGSDPRRVGDCALADGSLRACRELAWSPDGSSIAWVLGGNLWVLDVASGEVRDLVGINCRGCPDASAPDEDIAWSPDGTRIAYTRRWGAQIAAVTADGSSMAILVDRLPRGQLVGEPAWSPDGSALLFVSRFGWPSRGTSGLWVQDLTKGSATKVATLRSRAAFLGAAWSPDGSLIAWRSTDLQVAVARPDGSQAGVVYEVTSGHDLTEFDGPWFAPDGRALMVQVPTPERGAPQTLVIPFDGGQAQPVSGWSAAWGQGSP